MSDTETADAAAVDAFSEQVFTGVLGAMETLAIYVGDRMGLYRTLARSPATPGELAGRAGIHERYAREWCEQQAVAGVLALDHDGRFVLPPAHAEVLTDPDSLVYSSPFARMAVAAATRLPELMEVYRDGGGVPWDAYGPDARDAQGDVNRPWFLRELAPALVGIDDVDAVLSRPGARIADIGCGHGWSTIALARAYPDAHLVGVDVDAPSLVAARAHAEGVPNVTFVDADAGTLQSEADRHGAFDAAFVFEALHDMPHPVEVLTAVRAAVREDGVVIVMDEAVASDFGAGGPGGGDEIERIMYTYSVFICLPDSMSTADSAATGTVMRPATLEAYARGAGFAGVEVLPIEGFSAFRFYRLHSPMTRTA